ncbi:MAG: family 20 glycosylhydrolase [Acidobacteria bacterium]|nr:family 20 glycosylhydrolase [Acidobacteriota bacterium]
MPLLFAGVLAFAQAPQHDLMPAPASLTFGEGRLAIDGGFRVAVTGYDEPRLRSAAARLVERLQRRTGIPMRPGSAATLTLECQRASLPVQAVGEDESYTLEVTSAGARLRAPLPLGLLRGLETFLQLVRLDAQGFAVPAVSIRDQPRFAWRGLLIDAGRHFMPLAVLKRNIDGMAAVKLNLLHLHLSDDQGFRIESKAFPKLHQFGSNGQFYTQEQMREIVAYARERGIRVIPEFDMPGHTSSWFLGHPELASAPGPYRVERTWGVHYGLIDPTREEVYQFLDRFIGDMAQLFPDAYFHIGGDEVLPRQWNENAAIQAFLQKNGIRDAHALQACFNRRLLAIVTRHGKRMMGWDEILHPDLPKDIVIHSWRGAKSLAAAARQGYQGILSWGYYLDLMRPASAHYAVDPMSGEAAALSPEEAKRILGGEACLWSEYVSPEILDGRIWPRMAAIAERFWSPAATTDADSMYRRLEAASRHLELSGLTHRSNYRPILERIAGPGNLAALETLAQVVEPLKEYARSTARPYYSDTPLNHLVDAVPPESSTARLFNRRVERLNPAGIPGVRSTLARWRDNHARLLPTLERSALAAELAPVSEGLSKMAALGLEALDYREQGKRPPADWVKNSLALLDTLSLRPLPPESQPFCMEILTRHNRGEQQARKTCAAPRPAAELLIQIKPGIQTLLRALE